MASARSGSAAASRLRKAAFELARDQGFASLSTRALAEKTGGSSSAVSYHFGNRQQLASEVCAEMLEALKSWRGRYRNGESFDFPFWVGIASAFSATLLARISSCRLLITLGGELEQEARINGWTDVTFMLAADIEEEAKFWTSLATSFGAPPAHAQAWTDMAMSLSTLALSEAQTASGSAWIFELATRLQLRLTRQPVVLVPSPPDEFGPLTPPVAPANERGAKVLDAAIEEILEKGVDRLSQRDVAAKAGVSLSAVTYFFGPKHELVKAAFEEIIRRANYAARSIDVNLDNKSAILLVLSAADSQSLLSAMEILFRTSVRSIELSSAVSRMRTLRGIGSYTMLNALGVKADRVDSFLWIVVQTGSFNRMAHVDKISRRPMMIRAATERLALLFGYHLEL